MLYYLSWERVREVSRKWQRQKRKNGKLIKHVKIDPYIKIKDWAERYQQRETHTHIPQRQWEIDIKIFIL